MRALAAFGALACGGAVGLSAVAMHALSGHAATQAALAAAFGFAHGLALFVLAPAAAGPRRRAALAAIAAGVVLFSGSLAAAAFAGTPTGAAPFGGGLLMLGWALLAVDAAVR